MGRKAVTGTMLILLLIGVLTLAFNIIPVLTELEEEGVPYVTSSEMVNLKFWMSNGISYINISITFPDSGFGVEDWGTVVKEEYEIWVDSKIWDWTGYAFLVITTVSHTYELGYLEIGNYTFTFKAWGNDVKSINFTVTEVIPPPEKFLIITVDKETYHQGETMNITIKNISNETIWFSDTAYNLFFEKFNGTNWQFHTSIIGCLAWTPLEPGETRQIEWRLDVPFQPFPAGHYRVGTKGVYAEFDVFVPKSRLLLLETGKDVYVLGELVRFTLRNIGNETVRFGGWPFLEVYTWPNWERVAPVIFAFLLWKLDSGQSSSWTWNQTNEYTGNPIEAGLYVAKDIYGYNYTTFFRIIDATDPVPEFPSAVILPLFMILSIIVIIFAKRGLPRKPKN